jgi:hypothetical protein
MLVSNYCAIKSILRVFIVAMVSSHPGASADIPAALATDSRQVSSGTRLDRCWNCQQSHGAHQHFRHELAGDGGYEIMSYLT